MREYDRAGLKMNSQPRQPHRAGVKGIRAVKARNPYRDSAVMLGCSLEAVRRMEARALRGLEASDATPLDAGTA